MKVKFLNGTIKECSTPTEQKMFKQGEAAGWILSFALIGNTTSTEVDELIVPENISDLTFMAEVEEATGITISLTGYDKVSSAVIRHMDGEDKTRVELHLTKGV